ncbi:MAG: ribosome assembly cofactor RimP [Alistipes sp.]|jgi:ribosome maturation factor RimP|nr:ribosome assembly cofactor RimP [Alistipes sp.]
MDIKEITAVAEKALEGSDMFVVDCTIAPDNTIEIILDSDTRVSIDACAMLNHAIGEKFDRDVEDYSLTVASAGIGEPLKLVRQYKKLVGNSVEVLLKSGVKILATLDDVTEENITLSYDEAVVVEGKKKKQIQRTTHTYAYDEIKWTKEYLDYK